jgi:signal transduction histidine kinase/ActR/RegA family two-component response regulator
VRATARDELSKVADKSLGVSLAGLVLVAVVPLLIFGSGVAWLVVDQKRSAVEENLASTTRALRVAVDRELLSQFAAVQVLANELSLDQGRLANFHDKALRVLEVHREWSNVVLIDPVSHKLVASGLPSPAPTQQTLTHPWVAEVARTREPMIAGVPGAGTAAGKPLLHILAPVVADDQVSFVLAMVMDPKPLSDVFAEQQLAPSWTGAIVDKHMTLAGRSRDPARFLGLRATPTLADRIAASESGLFSALNQEGATAYTVFSRSAITGWSVAIGVPADEVEGPIRRTLTQLTVAGAALIAFALILAALVGRGIVRRRNTYEEALHESQARLQDSLRAFSDLVACIPMGVYKSRMRKEGGFCFEFVSTRWCEQLGVTADAIYQDAMAAFSRFQPENLEEFLSRYESRRTDPQPFVWEGRMLGAAGGYWLHIESTPTPQPNGDILWNGIQYDITERKLAEAELEVHRNHLEKLVADRTAALSIAKEAAEAANRAKTTFLANMSHELRTPMNGILGMADLATRRATDPKQKDQLLKVTLSARRLLAIINDILDISKIEAERLNLEAIDFRLSEALEHLVSLHEQSAREKGLNLVVDIDPELAECPLHGDSLRLGQILVNLTGNAIKFTATGSVSVHALAMEESPREVLLRFEVRDTGIGIAAEDQERLFTAFEQADGSFSRKYGGTGLGLAISKRLAEAMGGEIGVQSQPGLGSTFWFTARLAKTGGGGGEPTAADARPAEEELRARHTGARILLAEDDPICHEIARDLMEGAGLRIDTAQDGAEAVEMVKRADYDLIVMDIQMPRLNGVEATRLIRALPGRQRIPILAMTANAFAEDREQCLMAGMDDFITKPMDVEIMFATLLKWLKRGNG